jgi:hypothetical protein
LQQGTRLFGFEILTMQAFIMRISFVLKFIFCKVECVVSPQDDEFYNPPQDFESESSGTSVSLTNTKFNEID